MKPIYVEAPDPEVTWPIVFLGGGITDCPNWQAVVTGELSDRETECIIVNPRRENFPIDDPGAAKQQIEWEYHMLAKAEVRGFWFPAGKSVCPITLFELGKWMCKENSSPVIGIEPGYPREADVRIQTMLELGQGYHICSSLAEFTLELAHEVKMAMWSR